MTMITDEDLAQLRRVVTHAQTFGVNSVGGARTDVLAFLLRCYDERNALLAEVRSATRTLETISGGAA